MVGTSKKAVPVAWPLIYDAPSDLPRLITATTTTSIAVAAQVGQKGAAPALLRQGAARSPQHPHGEMELFRGKMTPIYILPSGRIR